MSSITLVVDGGSCLYEGSRKRKRFMDADETAYEKSEAASRCNVLRDNRLRIYASDDPLGSRLRRFAQDAEGIAEDLAEQSYQARTSGDMEKSDWLYDLRLSASKIGKCYHQLAAREIFRRRNRNYFGNTLDGSNLGIMDLHHLRIREAETYVKDHILSCKDAGIKTTRIICGRGIHSVGGIPHMRRAVMRYLDGEEDIANFVDRDNPGQVVVHFLENIEIQNRKAIRAAYEGTDERARRY